MPSEVTSDEMDLGVWGTTDTGRLRIDNQDTFLALELVSPPSQESVRIGPDSDVRAQEAYRRLPLGPRGALLVVADGMGGAAGGEIASRLAVTSVVEAIERICREDTASTPTEFAERLRDAFIEAHARIQAYAAERPWLQGMGTTMTAAGGLGGLSGVCPGGRLPSVSAPGSAARTDHPGPDMGSRYGRRRDDDSCPSTYEPPSEPAPSGPRDHTQPARSSFALRVQTGGHPSSLL